MEAMRLRDVVHGRIGLSEWFQTQFWHLGGLWQVLACLGAVAAGVVLARVLGPRLARAGAGKPDLKAWIERHLPAFLAPLVTVFLIHAAIGVSTPRGWPVTVTEIGLKFAEAWLVIQLFASILLPPGWTGAVTWTVAALFFLELLGVLDPFLTYMDKLALTFDNERVSVLEIVKAFVLLAVMLPLINRLCAMVESGLARVEELKPRVRVLVSKLNKAGLYVVAIVSALDLVGINLQMLTVFSGALGLGVGFGLQKVVSNLVSGVILLLDNSIKPGDVIEVGGVYGWVETMNARFASMLTRDGKSYLIPNDDLISGKVVNWSYNGPTVRLKIPVAIGYSSDLKLAMELMLKATQGKDRVLDNPEPKVLLREFGDNGIMLELRVWMAHPERGVANLVSPIQLSIWESFKDNGIELPFPKRDVSVKEPVRVQVEYVKPGGGETD